MRLSLVVRSLFAALFGGALAAVSASAGNIVDEWASVKVPPPPKLEAVTVDPQTTAYLVLDLLKQNCGEQKRPRCFGTLGPAAKLLKAARDSKAMVVYTMFPGTTQADIMAPVKPEAGELVVQASADKFIGTDLEKLLKDRGIKTVIIVGSAANGAVFFTASHAAFLGLNVVVPVDGMSGQTDYAEQTVAWNLTHAPTVAQHTKLTTADMIKF